MQMGFEVNGREGRLDRHDFNGPYTRADAAAAKLCLTLS